MGEPPAPLVTHDAPAVRRTRGPRWLAAVLITLAWVGTALGLAFTVPTVLGMTPHRVYAALQLFTPWFGIAAGAFLLVAAAYHRPLLAVAAGFCVIANVFPVWGAVDHVHVAPADGQAVSIYVSNMRMANATPEAQVDQALASGADVLVLVEFTPAYHALFDQRGVKESYPYEALLPADDPQGMGIYSRIPLVKSDALQLASMQAPMIEVPFADTTLQIVGVHTEAPKYSSGLDAWRNDLHALADYTHTAGLGPTVLAGDYNATRWHPEMRDVMSGNFSDAHEDVGQGLTYSWPATGSRVGRIAVPFAPFARLDHALVHDVGVVGVRDLSAAGSDHLPFVVTVVPQAS